MNIREMEYEDLPEVIECLRALSECPFSESDYSKYFTEQAFKERWADPNVITFVGVATTENESVIVATATLRFERKLSHSGALYIHCEDVAVHKDYQGKGYGGEITKFCIGYAKAMKPYKILLNCTQEKIDFYKKYGLNPSGNFEMFVKLT